jgi:hypothetical protein
LHDKLDKINYNNTTLYDLVKKVEVKTFYERYYYNKNKLKYAI